MIYFIYLLVATIALLKFIGANQEVDDEINNLFCQLNEYAVMRINDGENVFPCRD